MSVYKQHGYNSRKHYLECMAEDYGLPVQVVFELAYVLGPTEDFDGLVITLQDAADSGDFE
jgi:hypothetical protein